jgi:hypothetical protein
MPWLMLGYDRSYRITQPGDIEHFRPTGPQGIALREFLQKVAAGSGKFTLGECCEAVASQMNADNPEQTVSPDELRHRMSSYLADRIRAVTPVEHFGPGTQTRVTLDPAQQATLTHLIGAIEAVAEGDPGAIQLGQQLAWRIVGDDRAVRTLIEKAAPTAPPQPKAQTSQQLCALQQTLGVPASTRTLSEAYAQAYGRKLKNESIKEILDYAVERGMMRVITQPIKPGSPQLQYFFSAISPTPEY